MDNNIFFNPSVPLSYNCLLNFILSIRNGGKTYGCLKLCVNSFLKHGDEFIYVRRTDAEMLEVKDNIFDALINDNVFPNHELTVNGYDLKCDNKQIGYCIPLSKAYKMKSTAYPKVKYIIYDEFLVEEKNTHYLYNEPRKLLSLMETVIRLRDDVRVFLLGNYSSKSNPYFDYFKLYPKPNAVFTRHKTRPILIYNFQAKELMEIKQTSKMGQLVSGTSYGDYMYSNTPFADNDTFIGKPAGFLDYVVTYRFNGLEMAQYYAKSTGMFYISSKPDANSKRVFAFDTDSHEPNLIYIKQMRNHPNIKELKFAFENGLLMFENLTIKNTILELLNFT